ncbi:hypothetical protein R2R35_20025 [Anaerocolumna sp. AGMB13020]|nr:hypothetical protein [Anaerocolumna sp. AGMB13020]WOO35991.1 hypothetical protein R2R35_19670 [Anaerocolumna sp. AGMB13020]WOO36061.1 hypothetical protein R2R35_20025 [Anaerocolumna sp. AGMB13020]
MKTAVKINSIQSDESVYRDYIKMIANSLDESKLKRLSKLAQYLWLSENK